MSNIQERLLAAEPFCLGPSMTHISNAHECIAVVVPDKADGGFNAFVANLKGIHSQGETVDEAIANIREASQATIAHYIQKGIRIPWEEVEESPPVGAVVRRILVHV